MMPHEVNQLLAMLILGFPIAFVFGGPYLWRGFVIIAWLLLLALYPIAGLGVGVVVLLWRPLKWFAVAILGGFGAGLGLRASGFAQKLSTPSRSRFLPRAPRIQRLDDPDPQEPAPRIRGFTADQVRELRRRYPGEF
jgi:hypothetical protein